MVDKKSKSTLIVDLDNTLFDWVDLWHASFTAMMAEVTKHTSLSLETLTEEIRQVHQKHGTSEYAFLLDDLPSLKSFRNGGSATQAFSSAITAFRDARRAHLHLYPTVAETLLRIKGLGAQIVAYTESLRYYSFYRLKRLGLDGVVDVLYSPEDHEVPNKLTRHYPKEFYSFRFTRHNFTPPGEFKPNPDILKTILDECSVSIEDAVYVGDSLHKDIAMADEIGMDSAWAKYGVAQDRDAYELLKSVTHWTDVDIQREVESRARSVTAKVILETSFDELLDHFLFVERNSRGTAR